MPTQWSACASWLAKPAGGGALSSSTLLASSPTFDHTVALLLCGAPPHTAGTALLGLLSMALQSTLAAALLGWPCRLVPGSLPGSASLQGTRVTQPSHWDLMGRKNGAWKQNKQINLCKGSHSTVPGMKLLKAQPGSRPWKPGAPTKIGRHNLLPSGLSFPKQYAPWSTALSMLCALCLSISELNLQSFP